MPSSPLLPSPDALLTFVADFLRAAEDPERGAEVYDAYAEDGWLFYQFRPVQRREVDRAAFVAAFACAPATQQAHAPVPPPAPPAIEVTGLHSLREAGDGQAIAWFTGRERATARPLTWAVGWRREARGWRIGWLAMAPEVDPGWDYPLGLSHMLADAALGETNFFLLPRTALDLGHFRLYGHPRPALFVLPEARFSCRMNTACCTIDHRISVPPSAQALLDALPWERLSPSRAGRRLRQGADGQLELKENGQPCPYLDEQRQCLVHKALGRQPFPVCALFPFRFDATPDGLVVTQSSSCAGARSNWGPPLPERQADLHARALHLCHLPLTTAYALSAGHAISWEAFRATEAQLLEGLARTEDLTGALAAGLAGLEAMADARPFEAAAPAPLAPLSAQDAAIAERFLAMLEEASGLANEGGAPAAPAGPLSPSETAELKTFLRNLLFAKQFSFRSDLTTAYGVVVLAYVLAMRLRRRLGGALGAESAWQRLAGFFYHGRFYRVFWEEAEPDDPVRTFLAQPSFGRWLLASLAEAKTPTGAA